MSLKALSVQYLQGNRQGNQRETLSFPGGKLERKSNRISFPVFNPAYWQKSIAEMVADFGDHTPHAECWSWIQEQHPSIWREHRTAMKEINRAYQQQDSRKIEKAVSEAKDTYNAMLQAWNNRNQCIQPPLMAADRI